jgi:hypothetical protein
MAGWNAIGAARAVLAAAALAMIAGVPAGAQVKTVDPNTAIDADLATPNPSSSTPTPADAMSDDGADQSDVTPPAGGEAADTAAVADPQSAAAAANPNSSYQKDDLIGAAEGVFGKGAKGLAEMIEKILKDQGRPNAYIAGREASGAFVVGLRYGSGTLNHKIEGKREVYWTGPSVGFDVGGNASKTFVLVYNLYDTQDIFRRFPAGEGSAYLVGGFTASYLRRGDVVLIPIRLGVGYRLGVNAGYMKFTDKQRWMPF